MAITLGTDRSGNDLLLGLVEHRSGLYILGKPGMGKSVLLINMMRQLSDEMLGMFFLDPHGEAISDFLKVANKRVLEEALVFNPQDEAYSFGINLLHCENVNSLTARMDTYTRAYNVFYKLWENEWGPWLQLILQNVLHAFIENQEYTLAEVPMFLNPRNDRFREYIIGNIKHNPAVVDFWKYEFFERRDRDQKERVDAALTRINTLLTHPYIRHIVGQHKTTIDFSHWLKYRNVLLFRLSANLPADIKKFIGTIIVSELVHAVTKREEKDRYHYSIFVDEFQNFASSEDFTTLITEARKFKVATTIAHQERFGQFADNQKLMGATLAAANKILFQLTVKDAEELAPEFAKEATTTEVRLETELVIVPDPCGELMRRGHANPQIQEYVKQYWRPIRSYLERRMEGIEGLRLQRQAFQDKATLFRDEASLSQADEREESRFNAMARGRTLRLQEGAIEKTRDAIERTREAHLQVIDHNKELEFSQKMLSNAKERIEDINQFVGQLMAGHIDIDSGNELFAQYIHYMLVNLANCFNPNFYHNSQIIIMYIYLKYGDRQKPRPIPSALAYRYYPQEQEAAYMEWWRPFCEKMAREAKEHRDSRKATYGVWSFEDYMHYELDHYRQSEKFIDIGKGAIKRRGFWTKIRTPGWESLPDHLKPKYIEEPPIWLPDLPERVFSDQERERVLKLCADDIQESIRIGTSSPLLFRVIDDLIELCRLLQKPENHIKAPSGKYVEKPVSVRLVSDMTNEMAQELSNLPRYAAWAKVISEENGEQSVMKQKIKTLPLPQPGEGSTEVEDKAVERSHQYSKKREDIEIEIRERQSRWQQGLIQSQPPTAEEPPRKRRSSNNGRRSGGKS